MSLEQDRMTFTLGDCGVFVLSPKKQDDLAKKLIAAGVTVEQVAVVYREARRTTSSDKMASASMATLLQEGKDSIMRVISRAKPEEVKLVPGEGQWKKPEGPQEWDHSRKARMAYALSVHDHKQDDEIAAVIGCDIRDVPTLVTDGCALQKPDPPEGTKPNLPTPEEHAAKVQAFRRMCRGNQLPIVPREKS